MEATAQLNARMSKSLKESGDEALALIGFSPTQAVRALWEKAARRGKDLEEVKIMLGGASGEGMREDFTEDDVIAESWTVVEKTMESFGLDYRSRKRPEDMPSDKELLEQALYERMVERGLV